MNFRSIKNLSDDINTKLLQKLPRDICTVVGIPRSGMLPASIIATFLGVPLSTNGNDCIIGERGRYFFSKGNKILLVDDTVYGGRAMEDVLKKLLIHIPRKHIITCCIYKHPSARGKVDICAEILDGPRMFEWNFLGIEATKSYVFDLDGCICTDPRVFDDDGIAYENEISNNVKPLFLPQVKIHSICTNRIERWRSVTEKWLNKYNVSYNNLIMQPYKTAVERRKKSFTPEYKANYFNSTDGTVFIESSLTQAKELALRTTKKVLCIETMELL